MARVLALLIGALMLADCDQSVPSDQHEAGSVVADHAAEQLDPSATDPTDGLVGPDADPDGPYGGPDDHGVTDDPSPPSVEDPNLDNCVPVPGYDKVMMICRNKEHLGGTMTSSQIFRFKPETCEWDFGDPPDAVPQMMGGIPNDQFLEALAYYGCECDPDRGCKPLDTE